MAYDTCIDCIEYVHCGEYTSCADCPFNDVYMVGQVESYNSDPPRPPRPPRQECVLPPSYSQQEKRLSTILILNNLSFLDFKISSV